MSLQQGTALETRIQPSFDAPAWRALVWFVAGLLFVTSPVVSANGLLLPPHAEVEAGREANALDPQAVSSLDDHPYSPDPAFNGGGYAAFTFDPPQQASTPDRYTSGRKVARLANGDLVVAALVKKPSTSPGSSYYNIGLYRVTPSGSIRIWTNPTPSYGHSSNRFVIYPNSGTAYYDWIQGITVINGKILVAATVRYNGTDDVDTRILVFGDDGSFKSDTPAFASGMAEYAGGIAAYDTFGDPQIVVVASRGARESAGGGIQRPLFRRFSLNDAGQLIDQTDVVELNTHYCSVSSRDCRVAGVALGTRTAGSPPAIYVASRYYQPNPPESGWSVVTSRVSSNGVADASWPAAWWYTHQLPNGTHSNWPIDIAVRTTGLGIPSAPYRDSIFVASAVGRSCGDGVTVLRYDHDGVTAGGPLIGGSSASVGLCALIGRPRNFPWDIALSGTTLAVAGASVITSTSGEDRIDSFVSILDVSGTAPVLQDLREYPFGGFLPVDSGFWGIVATTNGRFVATGDGRYPNDPSLLPELRGGNFTVVLGIAPDRIFGNGFD